MPATVKLNAKTLETAVQKLEKLITQLIALAVCPSVDQNIKRACDEVYRVYDNFDYIIDDINLGIGRTFFECIPIFSDRFLVLFDCPKLLSLNT
jgi:hypothetical protein